MCGSAPGTGGYTVTGRVTILEKDDRSSGDVAQTVVWLAGADAPAGPPVQVEMATEGKQFVPRMLVLPLGSIGGLPQPRSVQPQRVLALAGGHVRHGTLRSREAKSTTFNRSGVVRVYCNVHAQMRGLVLVLESSLHTQPGGDGSFRLEGFPPGDYILHAWHERAGEVSQALKVTGRAMPPVALTLDARGYRFVQHKDKNGQSYSDRSRRY